LKKDLSGLTLSTLTNEQIESNRSSYTWVDITASLFVIVMVLYVMIYFS
jgi:solute:Na+ symporter, SSS family